MALAFNGAANYLSRTTNLPAVTTTTICGWTRVPTGGASVVTSTPQAEYFLNYVPADTRLYFGGYSAGAWPSNDWATGLPGVDTWFHWYLKETPGQLEAGFRVAGSNTYSVHTIAVTNAASFASMLINTDAFSAAGNAVYAATKTWNASLTTDEILIESYVLRPVRTADLNSWTPMVDTVVATAAKDFSGNGYDWTVNGSGTAYHGPPVSWGGSSIVVPYAASSSFTGTGAATLVLSASAAGLVGVTGDGASTLGFTAAATGTIGFAGTASATFTLTAAGVGTAGAVTGTGAAILTLSSSTVGAHGVKGTAGATFSLSASATGSFAPAITGTGAVTLAIDATGAGIYSPFGTLTANPLSASSLTAGALSSVTDIIAEPLSSSSVTAPVL